MSEVAWYVGQKVYSLVYGEGVVTGLDKSSYPVRVNFNLYAVAIHFTLNGKEWTNEKQTLFSADCKITVEKSFTTWLWVIYYKNRTDSTCYAPDLSKRNHCEEAVKRDFYKCMPKEYEIVDIVKIPSTAKTERQTEVMYNGLEDR